MGGLESRFFKAFRAEVSMLVGGSSRAEGGSAGGVDCCTGRAGDGIRVPGGKGVIIFKSQSFSICIPLGLETRVGRLILIVGCFGRGWVCGREV